jgi:hypothetical protein
VALLQIPLSQAVAIHSKDGLRLLSSIHLTDMLPLQASITLKDILLQASINPLSRRMLSRRRSIVLPLSVALSHLLHLM